MRAGQGGLWEEQDLRPDLNCQNTDLCTIEGDPVLDDRINPKGTNKLGRNVGSSLTAREGPPAARGWAAKVRSWMISCM